MVVGREIEFVRTDRPCDGVEFNSGFRSVAGTGFIAFGGRHAEFVRPPFV